MRSLRSRYHLVVLAGYGLGAAALAVGLPARVPFWWTAMAGAAIPLGALMVAFLLPTAVALTGILVRDLCIGHPIEEPGSPDALAICDAIMLRFALFVIGVHATVLLGVLGLLAGRGWAAQVVPVMLGLALISIGNLLPRTRRNLAIGIRTRATLADRAVWVRTHRSTGYLTVTVGLIIVLSAIAVPAPIGRTMVLLVGPAALLGTCLLARYARTHAHGDR